ncbi:MAG: HlyD family efflux transporter periplasmic adaptor subunit [Xanthobacteraceae bacterium]
MTALFRQEVLRHQSQAAIGETMRIVPISHAAFTLFLIGIIATVLTYVAFAGYSRKKTVQGFISPSRGVVRVVAPRVGTITEVLVKEGEVVAEDQILFRVVAEETNASGVGSDTAILDALKQQNSVLEEQIHNETEHAKSEADRLESQIGGLKSEVAQLESQRGIQAERAQSARAFYREIEPYKDKGYIRADTVQSRLQGALTEEQSLASIDGQLSAKRSDLHQAEINLERLPLDSADRLANLQRTLFDVAQHTAEIEGRRRYIVRAPIAGRVTSVLASVGGTIDTRTPLMSIVPTDSHFEADLFVPARAIGFVAPGQTVRLLYDAFPFQRFGSYHGTVESVATTMLGPAEMPAPVAGLKNPAYRVKVALERQTVDAFGHEVPLQPDMTLRADIILERRSFMEWLLEPLLSVRHRLS